MGYFCSAVLENFVSETILGRNNSCSKSLKAWKIHPLLLLTHEMNWIEVLFICLERENGLSLTRIEDSNKKFNVLSF